MNLLEHIGLLSGVRRLPALVAALLLSAPCLSAPAVLEAVPETVPETSPDVSRVDIARVDTDRVDIGGRRLALRCQGEGEPVVVMEAGLGDAGTVWEAVMARVARVTRACAYDRADLGDSDPAPAGETRTVQDAVDDLAALLDEIGLEDPVVLVGHSAGGLIATMFAHDFPERVAALALVDSSHPDQAAALAEVRPRRASEAWEAFLAHNPSLERWDVAAAFAQGRAPYAEAGSLGDLPLVVLSRETTPSPDMVSFYTEAIWPGYTLDILEREEEVWLRLQRDLAAMSSRSEHRIAATNDHYLHVREPDFVAAAVSELVAAARR